MLFASLETKVVKAQSDSDLLEKLIGAHQGFIRKCMIEQQKASGAQVEDEMTVAMLAFVEAVTQYDLTKGKFLSFARLIINRRMIDEYRKQLRQKPQGTLSLDEAPGQDDEERPVYEAKASVEAYESEVRRRDLQSEIGAFELLLNDYGLSFNELVSVSPKQEGLRANYQSLALWLSERPELMAQLKATKKLPAKAILEAYPIDQKRLDRGRKYIMALALLLSSDLERIKAYMERR